MSDNEPTETEKVQWVLDAEGTDCGIIFHKNETVSQIFPSLFKDKEKEEPAGKSILLDPHVVCMVSLFKVMTDERTAVEFWKHVNTLTERLCMESTKVDPEITANDGTPLHLI